MFFRLYPTFLTIIDVLSAGVAIGPANRSALMYADCILLVVAGYYNAEGTAAH